MVAGRVNGAGTADDEEGVSATECTMSMKKRKCVRSQGVWVVQMRVVDDERRSTAVSRADPKMSMDGCPAMLGDARSLPPTVFSATSALGTVAGHHGWHNHRWRLGQPVIAPVCR